MFKFKYIPTTRLLWGLFLLALSLRIIYFLEVRHQLLFQSLIFDAKYYDSWARQILTRGWLGKGIFFVSPLYAYFLAFIYGIGGSPITVKFIQFALGSSIPLLVYGIGIRLFSKRAAFLAALISCFYGPAIFFDGLLLKTTLEVFLIVLSIFVLVLAKDTDSYLKWFIPGIFMGLSTLAKDTSFLLIFLTVYWIYSLKGSFKASLKPIISFCLGSGLIIGALTARNIIIGKDFVLTTYSAGMNFHLGNFKGADGGLKEPDFIRIDPDYEEFDSKVEAQRRAGRLLKPSEISAFWFKETLREIKLDPLHFIRLLCRKAGLLINKTGLSDNYQMDFFKRYSYIFRHILIGFWPVGILGLSGIAFVFFASKLNKGINLLLLFFFGSSILLILGHIIDRYREILVPVLIIFAANFIWEIHDTVKKKQFRRLALNMQIIAVFAVLTSLPFPNFKQMPLADAHNQLGLLYHERGDFASAAREYQSALLIRPNHLWARQNLADIYLRQGRVDDAIKEYKFAIAFRPETLELYVLLKKAAEMKGLSRSEILKILEGREILKRINSLTEKEPGIMPSYSQGIEYILAKNYDAAIVQFKKILAVSPDSINTLINLGVAYRAKGEPQEAISSYEHALRIAPEVIPARYNLAMLLMSQKRFKEAIPHLEQIVGVFPEYMLAQYYLGLAYQESGEMNKALIEYNKIIARPADTPQARHLSEQMKEKVFFLEHKMNKSQAGSFDIMPLDKGNYE